MRISKTPEIRKQEILDTAMKVFYEKGYEGTSMNDIAKELKVVQGLCYRYFPSKQSLFDEAMEQSIDEICKPFLKILSDRSKKLEDRINHILSYMNDKEQSGRYNFFFHKPGNESLHDQLIMKICKRIIPYLYEELIELQRKDEIQVDNLDTLVEFIVYGQISLWECQTVPYEQRIYNIGQYIRILLKVRFNERNKYNE